MQRRNLLLILAAALLLGCCCLTVFTGVIAYLVFAPQPAEPVAPAETVIIRVVTATPRTTRAPQPAEPVAPAETVVTRIVTATPGLTPTPAVTSTATPVPAGIAPQPGALLSLSDEAAALLANEMPAADPRELALQFAPNLTDIPVTVNAAPPSYKVGDTAKFWVSNSDTMKHTRVTAELKAVTEHVAMWVQQGVRINQADLEASAKRFEEKTYPTNREFFGSEWTPGVDNDVRLHILHARGLGENVAGYYSSADEYSRLVNEYSNEREMFYISADSGSARPNSEFYDGTLAHEFQHMIHWANDRNETSWVNEGMSELASYLNGFDPGGMEYAYAEQPDTQLTTWADPSTESTIEHYGASYLFMSYFLQRFGEQMTKAVVASPRNGIPSFDEALTAAGQPERFDDVFADWVIANYLDLSEVDPAGRFGYVAIDTPGMVVAKTHRSYPVSGEEQVSQYGADYIQLRGNGAVTIQFTGQSQVAVVEASPEGSHSWWSNRGDQSSATLTRAFDLRAVKSANLTFSVWYDIEEGWDYAYVAVSTDGGKRWQILQGRASSTENPVGNAFGPGWTGTSGGRTPGWIDEQVDLTPFAGQEILLRFQMVTDDAVNRPGLLLDNIAIPEIGYTDDGEAGAGGWEAAGWALIDNSLDQRWLVQLVKVSGDQVSVERLAVGPDGRGALAVADLGAADEVFLVISGLTPVTNEPAPYSYTITR